MHRINRCPSPGRRMSIQLRRRLQEADPGNMFRSCGLVGIYSTYPEERWEEDDKNTEWLIHDMLPDLTLSLASCSQVHVDIQYNFFHEKTKRNPPLPENIAHVESFCCRGWLHTCTLLRYMTLHTVSHNTLKMRRPACCASVVGKLGTGRSMQTYLHVPRYGT